MNLKITDIKYKLFGAFMALAMILPLASCEDDLIYDPTAIGDGEASISAKLNFYQISASLNSRATQGGTPGDAIGEIESLYVFVYGLDGNLVKQYKQSDLENYVYTKDKNTSTSSDATPQAQAKTGQATFTIGKTKPENKLPYGRYHIYAVANMGDLAAYSDDIQTELGLQKISLKWNATDIAKNNQMFGYFTTAAESKSEGFQSPDLTINNNEVQLHSWIKRAVSKVTVAFNGEGLKENIWIFIKSVEIKDIPSECYLGDYNPADPSEIPEGNGGQAIPLVPDKTNTQKITYFPKTEDQIKSEDYTQERWPAFIAKGHPVFGVDSAKAVDPNLDITERIAAQHTETANALYFFENMQGLGKEGTESDKRQQVGKPDDKPYEPSYPDGVNPDNKAWKDAKKFGTYIEVKAHYLSNNPGDPGQGEIVYRFMLGKDTHLDYNAQRNHHYKLTLCFKGYANDVDWHIDYDKEDRPINNPNPYYISYLYNHSMMLPLHVDVGNDPNVTVTEISAEIVSNGWAPINAQDGAKTLPGNDQYMLYWEKTDQPRIYPWNGFLSLQKTTTVTYNPTPLPDSNNPLTLNTNKNYYEQSPARNKVTYSGNDVAIRPSNYSIDEALSDGKSHVARSKDEDGNYQLNINIPLWTRAKVLTTTTGYTGNNPFVAYQREAKIKVTVKLSNGETITSGLKDSQGNILGEEIAIRQVRRIVNPKGVWRKGNNTNDFHVVLKILPSEESTTFRPLASEGPWRAYVIRDTKGPGGTITLEGANGTTTGTFTHYDPKSHDSETYNTVEGSTGSYMDFTIKFKGKTSDDSPNYAVIRVDYHNYTCSHLIFVRQGYGADDIADDGVKWMTSNNVTKDSVASSPLDEGSMFKFGNWDYPIDASNNKNNIAKNPTWTKVKPSDFYEGVPADPKLDIINKGAVAWSNDKFVKNDGGFSAQSNMRVAGYNDYKNLYDKTEQGFGVLYGDDSSETLDEISDAYGYMSSEDNKNRGMRGCFVYNYKTGKNLFFPIGASGYGHRIDKMKQSPIMRGVLRYNCGVWRWGYFPTSFTAPNTYQNGGVDLAPLFFDIFRRPGAIYWIDTTFLVEAIIGWDINYFTFDFNGITEGNVAGGADACFVRSIQQ